MSYIDWQEKFVLGVEPLDQHHRNLVDLINDYHMAVESGLDEELLVRIFTRLRDYAEYHFSVEEALMAQNDFPATASHLAQHKAFTENIGQLESSFVRDHRVSQQVLSYLRNWLVQHILVIDRELAEHVKSHTAGSSPG